MTIHLCSGLKESTEEVRFETNEILIAAFNFSEINSNFRYFILKKWWYMMQHSIFNLLVANNRLLSAEFNIQFFAIWKIDYWLQHSIFNIFGANNGVRISTFNFCRSKNWLLNATFNFSVVVFEDLIIDDNIQFSIFLCKTMGCQLQHSILYSYDVYIRSFTFEFRRFVSEIRITGVNIQYAEVRAVGWTKSARTGKDSTLGHSTLNVV